MTGLQLIGTGRALPERCVTNDELSLTVDTSDAWISERTGIRNRYFCGEGESTVTLAVAAARQAMQDAGIAPEQIACCICATVSGDYATPSVACMVQAELGLPEDIPVLDVNAACSGFLYGTVTAAGLLENCGGDYALVIGCEQLSRKETGKPRASCLGARGSKAFGAEGPGPETSKIGMDGRAVFRFAVEAIPHCLHETLAKAGKPLDEVDWVVCHQANARIIDHCVKKLGAPPEKFYKNIDRYGNTSAASIPMALRDMREARLLKNGQTVLCIGFGGGLTWAGVLLTVSMGEDE